MGFLKHIALLAILAIALTTPLNAAAPATPPPVNEPASAPTPATPSTTKPPKVKVKGQGWWTNLTHTRMLERTFSLTKDGGHAPTFDPNEIEDAAFLLISQLIDTGYLHPKIEITATPAPAAKTTAPPPPDEHYTIDEKFDISRTIEHPALKVIFKLIPGLRYKLHDVSITGLTTLTEEDARAFFLPAAGLFGDASMPYSPASLDSAVGSFLETLKQKGHLEATVALTETKIDDKTGRVSAKIAVTEGRRWKITDLVLTRAKGPLVPSTRPVDLDKVPAPDTADTELVELTAQLDKKFLSQPWTPWAQQDIAEAVRQYYYKLGHPDIAADVNYVRRRTRGQPPPATPREEETERPTNVLVTIAPGEQVRIGQITREGNRRTRASIIRRYIGLKPGDLLNPIELEAARYRLGTLGVFRTIDLDYTPPDGPVRDVNFSFTETPPSNINLLMGWGSYEQLRGGIEYRRTNILGIADVTRVQLIQSMKSTSGDLSFTVPDLFSRNVNGTVRAFGLRREEIAFDREEYGGALSLRRLWKSQAIETTAGYTFESLNNSNDTLSADAGDTDRTLVAALTLALAKDRRDNPLSPKHGYNWFLNTELASEALGGRANYMRARYGFNYHATWRRTRWIHAGISQGVIGPYDDTTDSGIPVNKLFYPGGENSIRGYQDGEAAPRDENGAFLGAKVYTQINLEFEQALAGSLNFVVFYDLLGESADISAYPGDEWLSSVGVGLRYHTILGPLRVEYGYNLNRREGDPRGTLHFSVGMPF